MRLLMTLWLLLLLLPYQALGVTLAWDPNNPAPDGYRVFQRLEGESYDYSTPVWPGVGDDDSQVTATIDNLQPGVYYFVVRAYVGPDESGDSNEVQYIVPPEEDHTITSTTTGAGSIDPSGIVNITSGGQQSYIITPDSGNIILDVFIDGISYGPINNFTFENVIASHTIEAIFQIDGPVPVTTGFRLQSVERIQEKKIRLVPVWSNGRWILVTEKLSPGDEVNVKYK
jgi:hypothetical protein